MTQASVALPRSLVNQLLHLAQSSPEAEVCGLIGALADEPVSCYPVANVASDPARRFRLDPAGQIAAMRQMRERGERLYAIFHSHPSAPAEPSPLDRAEASYPDTLYLIISLNTQGVLEMRGFRQAQENGFQEVALYLK
ncbi:MAG: M67 family metallopeptidase [Alteraurantiacibacter sp.]|nr:M67 family metallopeptidase [Alteraurantiacibacter sp.]